MPKKPVELQSAPTDASETSEASDVSVSVGEATSERKPKSRVMSETQLAQLALAREKAVLKRRELGDLKRREKAAKEDLLSKRIESLRLVERAAPAQKQKQKQKQRHKKLPETETESSEESEEPEPVRVRRSKPPPSPPPSPPPRTKRTHAKTQAHAQDYSTPQLTAEMARQELLQRVQRETYQAAYSSMFPGCVLKF